jgi:glucose/arabinose dehydrogenase
MDLLSLAALAGFAAAGPAPRCAADNGGLKLPEGFCAVLVKDKVPMVRHLAVASNGDVLVAHLRRGVLLFRDTDGDGAADEEHVLFGGTGGSGLLLAPGAVYFATNDSVLRIPYRPGDLEPSGPVETVARGLPAGGHAAKGLALGKDGSLFVSFGSLSNSCQKPGEDRRGAFASPNPCVELEQRAGIWRFDAPAPGRPPPPPGAGPPAFGIRWRWRSSPAPAPSISRFTAAIN